MSHTNGYLLHICKQNRWREKKRGAVATTWLTITLRFDNLTAYCNHSWGTITLMVFFVSYWFQPFFSVSGTCRIPKRLLYTVREGAGFMGCIPAGRSWMPLRNLHTRLWSIVSTKNECLVCSVLQSRTLSPFEFFIKRLSMMFVVSQSLYTLALKCSS